MNKAIMISIKPKWVAKILNGEKTIEIRKSKALANAIQKLIDEYGFAEIYVYCTKDNKQRLYPVALLDKSNQVFKRAYREDKIDNRTNYLNGKVPFKFRCYKVEKFDLLEDQKYKGNNYEDILKYNECIRKLREIAKCSCLTICDLVDYCDTKALGLNQKEMVGYAIHISDLEIFDKPKELSEFIQSKRKNYEEPQVQKAPQSWCYVEV